MGKLLPLFILVIIAIMPLGAASVRGMDIEDTFESVEELARFDFSREDGINNSFLSDVEISLVTQSPADEVYSWFGHAGLMIETPLQSVMYDWGVFSFSPSFYIDFVLGRLYYQVIPTNASSSINRGIANDRTVSVLTLPLDNAAKQAVIDFVNYNVRSENSTYLYHYYLDNCATRIRDIVSAATGGDFQRWAEGIDTGMTFRDYSTERMQQSLIVNFTLNALQGPSIDRPLNLYEATFLPDVLMEALEAYYDEEATVVYETGRVEKSRGNLLASSLIIGLALAVVLYTLASSSKRAYGLVSLIPYLYLNLISIIMIFVMCFTNHDVAWNNENIIFVNPLLLIPLFQGIACIFSKKTRLNATITVFRILLVLSIGEIILKGLFPTVFIQDNFPVLALVMPLYLVFALKKKEN